MPDETVQTAEQSTNQSSGSDSSQSQAQPSAQEKLDQVSYETHRKLLDEKKKLQVKFEEFTAKEKAREEALLVQKGNFEELLKMREKELEETKSKVSSYESRFQTAKKLNAFMKSVGQDLDDKWLSLVDLNAVAFKPDSDEVDEISVISAVESFKKTWPEALRKLNTMPIVDAPNGISMITESEWKKLGGKDKAKYKPTQIMWEK